MTTTTPSNEFHEFLRLILILPFENLNVGTRIPPKLDTVAVEVAVAVLMVALFPAFHILLPLCLLLVHPSSLFPRDNYCILSLVTINNISDSGAQCSSQL